MTPDKLDDYLRERLGSSVHQFEYHIKWNNLKLRYYLIGDKLFDMDPEDALAPCFLPSDAFFLLTLEPKVEMLHYLKSSPIFVCPDIFSNSC